VSGDLQRPDCLFKYAKPITADIHPLVEPHLNGAKLSLPVRGSMAVTARSGESWTRADIVRIMKAGIYPAFIILTMSALVHDSPDRAVTAIEPLTGSDKGWMSAVMGLAYLNRQSGR
jgi:hypothetical protein